MPTVDIKVYDKVGSLYSQLYRQPQQFQQHSGTTVYRGARRWQQRGDGIGDIFRGIARFMIPVVMRGVSAFAGETLDANERGANLGEAAKGALKPALHAAVQAIAEGFHGGGTKKRQQHDISAALAHWQTYKRRKAEESDHATDA